MDEIGDLPADLQIRLLRVIDQKRFRRMGGSEDITVDVQVVTATNRPLEEMITDDRFREDLYYRLKVFEIHLPPLRRRRILAEYFLQRLRKKGRTPAKGFSDNAIELMLDYEWPGNVRELKSVVESMALRCRLEGITKATKKHLEPLLLSHDRPIRCSEGNVFKSIAETELRMVENALIRTGGKKIEAWKLLNYRNRFSMFRRVKRIMSEYPDLAEQFPQVKRLYS